MDTEEKLGKISAALREFFSLDEAPGIAEMIFLAGLQSLGKPAGPLSRDDKMNVMHIGTCVLLEPYGYYRYSHRDADGYPHYEPVKERAGGAPSQDVLADAIVNYFAGLLKD